MGLKVVWTKRAFDNYLRILDYILENFGNPAARNYNNRINEVIEILRSYPEIGTRQAAGNHLRAIIIFKRTTLFYVKKGSNIRIINVVDNRWQLKGDSD